MLYCGVRYSRCQIPLQYCRELKVLKFALVVRSLSTVPYVSYREIAVVCVCVVTTKNLVLSIETEMTIINTILTSLLTCWN